MDYDVSVGRLNLCTANQQVDLSSPSAELRVLEVFYHKIYKVLVHLNAMLLGFYYMSFWPNNFTIIEVS